MKEGHLDTPSQRC